MPCLFRVHPKPDILKIKNLTSFLRSRRINAKLDDGNSVNQLSKLVGMVDDRKDKTIKKAAEEISEGISISLTLKLQLQLMTNAIS